MTTRPFALAVFGPWLRTLWTIALVLAMGATLSACETFNFNNKPSTSPSQAQAPRPTTVTPTPTGEAPGTPTASVPANPNAVRVALLLPFSAPSKDTRAVSQALLNAAQMAMFDMGSRTMTLIPRDTGTTPESAAAAANDAINQGAELILGPLLAADVRVVAPIARAKNVPVIAFSTDRTVAGDGVFLLSFLPETEVTRIINYAISQGRSRFAALIPATPYGQRVEEAFRATVTAGGRQVVSVQSYQPNPQALEPAINAVAKSGLGYDAIFLPEGGVMLRSIAPILLGKGVDSKQIRLLGTGLWDDPAVAKDASLIGGWYSVPPQDQRQNFINKYQQNYQVKPPRIATLAYDGVALAATLSRGPAGRRYTTATITDPNGFSGIDGIFRFLPNGFTERGLAVMEIAPNGSLIVASPAASTFQSQGF